MWNKIGHLIEKRITKNKDKNVYRASMICYLALKVGRDLFHPVSFKNGVLSVLAHDSSSAAMILLSQQQIINKINQKLGAPIVKKIKIKIE